MCYNEEDTVVRVGELAQKVLKKISSPKNEILFVDDGSSDHSPSLIKTFQKKHRNVRAVFHPHNMGIGAALRSGYFHSRFENVCVVPADGQFDLGELVHHPRLERGTCLSFCRKKQKGYSFFRILLSRANQTVNRFFLGIRLKDINWVKVYKREALSQLGLRLHSSLIESEICAKLIFLGHRFIEIPSIYHGRSGGQARGASLKIVMMALRETCLLIWTVWSFRISQKPK
jgi:glycosyltransferase involved in cell wall biosynthesis